VSWIGLLTIANDDFINVLLLSFPFFKQTQTRLNWQNRVKRREKASRAIIEEIWHKQIERKAVI